MSRGRGRQGRQVVLAAVPPRTPLLDYYWTSRRVFKTQEAVTYSSSCEQLKHSTTVLCSTTWHNLFLV